MKGIVCEQVGSFRLRDDLPEPERKPGEAIVQIRRVGICGTDMHAFAGNQPYFTYPRILGHELSGTIAWIGDNEAGLSAGDSVGIVPYLHCGTCIACRRGRTNCCADMRVMGVHVDGGMRDLVSVPVTHLIKTDDLTLDQAAMLEPLAIGAHAVRRSGLGRGETALVIGAGPIGLGAMVFARLAGARVIAMDLNKERLAFCQSWAGASHLIQAAEQPGEQLRQLTEGRFPEVVIDATGNAASMAKAFGYVAHSGTLVYVGLVKNDISFSHPEFHKRETTLMGSRNATLEDFDRVLQAVKQNAIDIDRFISHRASKEHMIEQFGQWLKPESQVIKAMVEWS